MKRTKNPLMPLGDCSLRLWLTNAEVLAMARGEMPQTVRDALHEEAVDLLRILRSQGELRDEAPTESRGSEQPELPGVA